MGLKRGPFHADFLDMPDLSNLLGAVYGDGPSKPSRDAEDEAHVEHEPAADERTLAVPDWADDEHLDAAFAEWKPGPSADASPTEQAFVMDADDDPAPPLADDLAAALSEALVAASGSADDTDIAPDPQLGQPATRFDFSAFDDEPDEPDEPMVEETDNTPDLSKSEIQPLEQAQTEQAHELGEVGEPELVHQPEPELVHQDEPSPFAPPAPVDEEPVHVDEPEVAEDPQPSVTSQRAAAAELTAASRVDPQPMVEAPAAPEPEPMPVASTPVPAPSIPTPVAVPAMGDGGEAPTTMMAGTRRWDRSDDDILPDKPAGKKFFSFSLRRG